MPRGQFYDSILSDLKIVLPSFVIFHNCGNQFHILWNKIMTTTQMKLNFPTSYRNLIIFLFTYLHNLMKYPFLKWQRIFYFLRRYFSFPRLLPHLTVYMINTTVSHRKRELLTLRQHLGSSWFLVRSVLLFCFLLCVWVFLFFSFFFFVLLVFVFVYLQWLESMRVPSTCT